MSTTTAAIASAPIARIAEWLRLLRQPGEIIELRALAHSPDGRFPSTMAGFFDHDHLDEMARQAHQLSTASKGVYWTLNPLHPAILSRCCNRVKRADSGDLAADKNVLHRHWLLVDADPVRPVDGIPSTEVEKQESWGSILLVREHLEAQGWPAPILADSGNGYHLLYRIDLPADDGGLVERCLKALAAEFDNAAAKIDQKVFNASRICKLYGTVARKGDSTAERPHRASAVLEVPDAIATVPMEALQALGGEVAKVVPTAPARAAANGQHGGRDDAERCWRYIDKIPRSVAGQDGHGQLWQAARVCIQTFGQSDDGAFELLRRWNQGCQPEWSDKEIRHKIDQAQTKARQAPQRREFRPAGIRQDDAQSAQEQSKGPAPESAPPVTTPIVRSRCMADIHPMPIEWLWQSWIPRGTLTLLDGDPGLGKSFVSLDLAARVSTGRAMPDELPDCRHKPSGVLMLNAEDDLARTVRPRLDALGADMSRCFTMEEIETEHGIRPPCLPDDLDALEGLIVERGATLVVIDPLMAYFSADVDPNSDPDVRRVLYGLRRLAERTQAAILVIRHLNKMVQVSAPIYRGGGSIGIIGAARSALLIAADPDMPTRRVLA